MVQCDQGSELETLSRSKILVLLLTLLSSAALSGQDFSTMFSLGVPSIVLSLRKLLALEQPSIAVCATAQVVLDERPVRRAGIIISPGHAPYANLNGPEAAALMKVGVRVVRGPDWKWGDQVNEDVDVDKMFSDFFLMPAIF